VETDMKHRSATAELPPPFHLTPPLRGPCQSIATVYPLFSGVATWWWNNFDDTLAMSTEYRPVTDGQTDRQTCCDHGIVRSTHSIAWTWRQNANKTTSKHKILHATATNAWRKYDWMKKFRSFCKIIRKNVIKSKTQNCHICLWNNKINSKFYRKIKRTKAII